MTLRVEDFRPEFAAWIGQAGFGLWNGDGRHVEIAPQGGEFVYILTELGDGWIRATRSDHGGEPEWEFDAASVEVIERHFTSVLGATVRSRAGLGGTVRVPFLLNELASGATLKTLVDWEFSNVEEVALDGSPIGRFRYISGRVHPAVEASHYCSGSIEQVEASFLDPDGKPLFSVE